MRRVTPCGFGTARAVAGALALAGTMGCEHGPVVRVRWAGNDTASVTLAARAAWCAPAGPLVLLATSGDTGLGVAVFPGGKLAVGTFNAVPSASPPRATVALRWPGKSAVNQFSATDGKVTLDRAGGRIAGRLSVHATSPGIAGVLQLNADFSGVPVASGGPDCGPRPGVD